MIHPGSLPKDDFVDVCSWETNRLFDDVRAALPGIRLYGLIQYPGALKAFRKGWIRRSLASFVEAPTPLARWLVPREVEDFAFQFSGIGACAAFPPTRLERALARGRQRPEPPPFLILSLPTWYHTSTDDFRRMLRHEMMHAVDAHRVCLLAQALERIALIGDRSERQSRRLAWYEAGEVRADLFALLLDALPYRDNPYVVGERITALADWRAAMERDWARSGRPFFRHTFHRHTDTAYRALEMLTTESGLMDVVTAIDHVMPYPALPARDPRS